MSIAARERRLTAVPDGGTGDAPGEEARGGIRLARVTGREGDAFRVRVAGAEWLAECDPSVDPALVEAAIGSGARVVLDDGPPRVIVGALATARAVEVSRGGEVDLSVKRSRVAADDEIALRTDGAFLRAKGGEVEIFGRRILSRAREVARFLARAIQLN